MKHKRLVFFLAAAALIVAVLGLLGIFFGFGSTVNHALRISERMQPVLKAENQAMHMAVSAEIDGKTVTAESDVFLVTEEGVRWLILDHNGNAVYAAENILYLENGKAFKIADSLQVQTEAYWKLLPQIMALFETLEITEEDTDYQTAYSVAVSGAQVNTLLAAASLGETLPEEGTGTLKLTEKDGKLHSIVFSGSGNADEAAVQLQVTLSGFRILAAGDYPIPDVVRQAAATENRSELFSLTEDLYRLVQALMPFADMDSIEGSLELAVDCGPLQLDTRVNLSDLKTDSKGQTNPETLQKLPEILGLMCMEGDLSCTKDGGVYVYRLMLDQPAMQQLAGMILPELVQYGGDLTEGEASILLETGKITSMNVSIEGKARALILQIPITVEAEFVFE